MDEQKNVNTGRDQYIFNSLFQKQIVSEPEDYPYCFQRFIAFLIDFFISFIIPLILGGIITNYYNSLPKGWLEAPKEPPVIFYIILAALSIAYYPLFESCPLQGTIGKFIMGLMVVDTEGERILFSRSLLRLLVKLVSIISIFAVPLIFIELPPLYVILVIFFAHNFLEPIARNKTRQTIHDLITNCMVVRRSI